VQSLTHGKLFKTDGIVTPQVLSTSTAR